MRLTRSRGASRGALLLWLVMAGAAVADDAPFTVTDIRVEGLQRIPGGHVVQYIAREHRRHARRAARARGAARGVRHGLLSRRATAARGSGRVAGGGAGASLDPRLRSDRQQGTQDRGSRQVAAIGGPGLRQDPRSLHARGRAPVAHAAVLRARTLRREGRHPRGGPWRQPGRRQRRHRRGQTCAHPPDKRGRQ